MKQSINEIWKFVSNFCIMFCFIALFVAFILSIASFFTDNNESTIICFLQDTKVWAMILDMAFMLTAIEVWGLEI